MQNLKKLLLVGLLAISFSPVALAGTVYCPGTGSDPRVGDATRQNPQQSRYDYNDATLAINPDADRCPLSTPADFVSTLGRIFTAGAAIIAVISGLFILSAAFMYVTSHGDEEKVGQAKNTIIYAIMGLVLAGLAYGVPLVVRSLIF